MQMKNKEKQLAYSLFKNIFFTLAFLCLTRCTLHKFYTIIFKFPNKLVYFHLQGSDDSLGSLNEIPMELDLTAAGPPLSDDDVDIKEFDSKFMVNIG